MKELLQGCAVGFFIMGLGFWILEPLNSNIPANTWIGSIACYCISNLGKNKV